MERRFFERIDVAANGELLWATKGLVGRVQTHRAYLMTENLSVDGARVALRGKHHLPPGIRARFKLGLEFCDVELLDVRYPERDRTDVRMHFLSPSRAFLEIVEQYLPAKANERAFYQENWLGDGYR